MSKTTSVVAITQLVEVNPARSALKLHPDDLVSFIPMADASESGEWLNRQVRVLSQVDRGYTAFQEGDVLFAKITPCMENGKGLHAIGLKNGVGFGSTEFHVLRAKNSNVPRFVFHLSHFQLLRKKAEARMTGSAGQRRVPTDFFNNFHVPLLTERFA